MADKDTKSIVEEARERYELAKSAYSDSRMLAVEDTKFALGDSDNGWQWPDNIRRNRVIEQRACLTVNLTAQHCNQIMNNIRQNRPACRVLPASDGSDKKVAEIMSGLIRNIQNDSNADEAHDTAAEHSIYGGEGYWRVITEYESETSFNQAIRIKAVPNPMLVYIDPTCQELDKSDAEWGFVFEDISLTQCKREYPDVDPASWVEDTKGWVSEDTVRRAEYFYVEYKKDVLLQLDDGTTILQSDVPDEAKDLIKPMIVKQRETQRKQWKWCKLLGGEEKPLDEKDWPGSFLPIISVVGKEVNVNGEIVRKGIVRDLKDPARMVNYSYSAAIETVALQNKIPYIAPVEAIEGYEQQWANANNSTAAYLPYNSVDEGGNKIEKPERQQPAVMPSAQVSLLQLSTEQMRGASGQTSANFGIKSEAASGIGIHKLQQQGDMATFHFPDNQVRGLRYEAVILIDLIPKIYDTKRVVRILGLDGKDQQAILDPDAATAYQENDGIDENDIQKIFNPSLGEYDVVIDTGPSYMTQRQEAAAALTDLAGKDPQLMSLAGDLIMRSYDFPMADQIANRLEKALPPGLKDNKGQAQIPPEAQQQMQQMQQALQQSEQHMQALEAEVSQLKFQQQAKVVENQGKLEEARVHQESELARALADVEIAKVNAVDPSRLDQAEQILAALMQNVNNQQMQAAQPPMPQQPQPDPMQQMQPPTPIQQ